MSTETNTPDTDDDNVQKDQFPHTATDSDYEKDLASQRASDDQILAQLRKEVDVRRAIELEEEKAFFQQAIKNYPKLAEIANRQQQLRNYETNQIAELRAQCDEYIAEQRSIDDDETDYQLSLRGDHGYQKRLGYWSESIDAGDLPVEPDASNTKSEKDHEDRYGDLIYYGYAPKDFRSPDFLLEQPEKEEHLNSYINRRRLDSLQFWQSMQEKYPVEYVDYELKALRVDPVYDFQPFDVGYQSTTLEIGDAYNAHSILEWRLVGDAPQEWAREMGSSFYGSFSGDRVDDDLSDFEIFNHPNFSDGNLKTDSRHDRDQDDWHR